MRDLIIAGVVAAASFGAAWKTQDWRYGEQINQIKADAAEATKNALKQAADQTAEMQRKKDEALNEANKRAQDNARAAATSRNAANGLRQQLDQARASLPQATCEAARNYAATLSTVFSECAGALAEMAGRADQATSDALMLDQAWPSP